MYGWQGARSWRWGSQSRLIKELGLAFPRAGLQGMGPSAGNLGTANEELGAQPSRGSLQQGQWAWWNKCPPAFAGNTQPWEVWISTHSRGSLIMRAGEASNAPVRCRGITMGKGDPLEFAAVIYLLWCIYSVWCTESQRSTVHLTNFPPKDWMGHFNTEILHSLYFVLTSKHFLWKGNWETKQKPVEKADPQCKQKFLTHFFFFGYILEKIQCEHEAKFWWSKVVGLEGLCYRFQL